MTDRLALQEPEPAVQSDAASWPDTAAVLRRTDTSTTRLAGDRYVFVEFGDMVLDFGVRAKVAEVQKWLAAHAPPGSGFVESSPGVRSVLLEYDAARLPLTKFLALLERCVHPFQRLPGLLTVVAQAAHKLPCRRGAHV